MRRTMVNLGIKHHNFRNMGYFLIILAVLMATYPIFNHWVMGYYQQHKAISLQQKLENQSSVSQLKQAQAYNQQLNQETNSIQDFLQSQSFQPKVVYGIKTEGIYSIGTLWIPSIHCILPIFDGSDEEILAQGVGHVPFTSYPLGGISTHTVLAAHSGLLNGEYFLRLPQVKKKAVFYIRNATGLLAYQVFRIQEVAPQETTPLQIQTGADLATLVTCVPIGINNRRLLVTGKRIDLPKNKARIIKKQFKQSSLNWANHLSRRAVMLGSLLFWIGGGMFLLWIVRSGVRWIYGRVVVSQNCMTRRKEK